MHSVRHYIGKHSRDLVVLLIAIGFFLAVLTITNGSARVVNKLDHRSQVSDCNNALTEKELSAIGGIVQQELLPPEQRDLTVLAQDAKDLGSVLTLLNAKPSPCGR